MKLFLRNTRGGLNGVTNFTTRVSVGASNQNGFTLIEALVSISVMAIIVAAMASGITLAFRAVYFQRTGATAVDEGRRLMPIITKDLLVAKDSSLVDCNAPIWLGQGTPLTLNGRDPEFNTVTSVVYSLAGYDLVRTSSPGPVSRTVARNVFDASFLVCSSVYTVAVVTQSEGNTRSQATNTWQVYQRTVP